MFLSLLALAIVPASAQSPAPTRNAATAAALQATDAQKLVAEFQVNGLKVLVKRREGSQTVAAALFIQGGSRNVTADNAGVEGLMLDMASEASTAFPRERFRRELARTGTVINAGVNRDYSGLTLGSTRQYFDRAWEIFTDAVIHPSFAQDDFERVQKQRLIALSDDEDTPDSYLQVLQSRVIYAGHPYLVNPHGTTSSISKLTIEDVRKFHQQMMQTSRLMLVVVGDIDPKMLEAKVAASFGKLPKGDYKPTPPPALAFVAPSVSVTSRELPTNYVQGAFSAPAVTSADIYPMRVAITSAIGAPATL